MKNTKYHRVELSCKGELITWNGHLYIGEAEGRLNLALLKVGGDLDFSCTTTQGISDRASVSTSGGELTGGAYDINYHQQSQEFTCEWIPAFLVQIDVPLGTVDQEGVAVSAAYVVTGHDGVELFSICASGREVLVDEEKTSKPVDPRPLAKVIQFPGNRVVH